MSYPSVGRAGGKPRIGIKDPAVKELEADYIAAVAALRGLMKWCDDNINGVPHEYGLRMAAADEVLAKADKRVWPK